MFGGEILSRRKILREINSLRSNFKIFVKKCESKFP